MYSLFTQFNRLVVIAVIAAFSFSCSSSSETSTTTEGEEKAATTEEAEKAEAETSADDAIYKTGDPVEFKMSEEVGLHFITTVRGVREFVASDPIDRPEEGNRWLLAKVSIENKGKEAPTLSGQEFKLVDGEGNTYEPSLNAEVVSEAKTLYSIDTIDIKADGEVGFEIPKTASDLKLLFDPSFGVCESAPQDMKALGVSCDEIPFAIEVAVAEDPNATAKSATETDAGSAAEAEKPQARKPSEMGAIARAQQAYYLENQQFATAIADLELGLKEETEEHAYEIVTADDTQMYLTVTAKKAELKSYSTLVFAEDGIAKVVACETNSASQTAPDIPQVSDGTASCPSGSSELKP